MFGFLTFGTTLTFLDQAFKARIEKEEKGTFPRELAISKGKIKLYQNHNEGFSFGILKGSRAVQLVPFAHHTHPLFLTLALFPIAAPVVVSTPATPITASFSVVPVRTPTPPHF